MRHYVSYLAGLFPLSFLHSHPTTIFPLPGLNTAASLAPTTPSGSISIVAFRRPAAHYHVSDSVLSFLNKRSEQQHTLGEARSANARSHRSGLFDPRAGLCAAQVSQGARDGSLVLPPTFVDAGRSDPRVRRSEIRSPMGFAARLRSGGRKARVGEFA